METIALFKILTGKLVLVNTRMKESNFNSDGNSAVELSASDFPLKAVPNIEMNGRFTKNTMIIKAIDREACFGQYPDERIKF